MGIISFETTSFRIGGTNNIIRPEHLTNRSSFTQFGAACVYIIVVDPSESSLNPQASKNNLLRSPASIDNIRHSKSYHHGDFCTVHHKRHQIPPRDIQRKII
eukprot:TRINITY_DN4448_c1_g1_i2.p1 TRINITY_DN4448_c1_g1~~TRINITY_DN4448_c1_g1_i2.p1  ORF type:complete len:102 (+),score=5.90 TRINITY_DN4448_c1_g1_i2:592-897(+)